MARLGGSSFVITSGEGSWRLETRRGVVMDGAPPSMCARAFRCSPRTATRSGSARSPTARTLTRISPTRPSMSMAALVDKPLINLESAANHPCQALADWKTLDDLTVPRNAQLRALLGLPSACAAARGASGDRAHGGDARHAGVVLRPGRLRAAARDHGQGRARRGARRAARCARRASAPKRSLAPTFVYAKEWGATAPYGDAAAMRACGAALTDWCVREQLVRGGAYPTAA